MSTSRISRRPRRRLAVLAVSTTLAVSGGAVQAAPVRASTPEPAAQRSLAPGRAAARPPENVLALARGLGVDTNFAWRTLDELARQSH